MALGGRSAPTVASAPGGSRTGKQRSPIGSINAMSMAGMEHATALWTLVALEMLALVGLRHYFRRHHGG